MLPAARPLLYLVVVFTHTGNTLGQNNLCTSGFPGDKTISRAIFRDDPGPSTLMLIPSMRINCSGMVVGFTVATRQLNGTQNLVIQFWRPSQENYYYRETSKTSLGPYNISLCDSNSLCESSAQSKDDVFKCNLIKSAQVPVEEGDILGLELSEAGDVGGCSTSWDTIAFESPTVNDTAEDSKEISSKEAEYYVFHRPTSKDKVNLREADNFTQERLQISIWVELGSDKASTDDTKENTTTPVDDGDNVEMILLAVSLSGSLILILLVVVIALVIYILVQRRKQKKKHMLNPITGSNHSNSIHVDYAVPTSPSGQPADSVISFASVSYSAVAPNDYCEIDDEPTPEVVSKKLPGLTSATGEGNGKECVDMSQHSQLRDATSNYSHNDSALLKNRQSDVSNSVPTSEQNHDYEVESDEIGEPAVTSRLSVEGTFWEPANTVNELYKQLSSKKYNEIVREEVKIHTVLGTGQFGEVNEGIWQSPMGALDVAVKQLQPGAAEEEKVKFLQEAAINGQFRHPNVVQLMGVVTVGEPTMIVLELLSNGDLRSFLMKQKPTNDSVASDSVDRHMLLRFCQQIATGMGYLESKSFVHRDLAARNILVSDERICKISDFGMSRDLMDEKYYVSHGGKVPVKWTAPEAIHYKKYSTASDVWSFGCAMYEIWSLGHKPFENLTNVEVIRLVDKGYRLPPPPGLPKELYKIMIQCWQPEKKQRPTFLQLVELLSRANFELFVWEEEDLNDLDPQVKVIGAPLETARNLYLNLQRSYQTN